MKAGWMTVPLAFVATFAFVFAVGSANAGSSASDDDSDGIQNDIDNCDQNGNADQTDTDADGYGNRCDGDFNQDGLVGGPDFAAFTAAFLVGDVDDAPQLRDGLFDCNNDRVVGGPDFACFTTQFLNGLGSSGRSCVQAPGSVQYGHTVPNTADPCPPDGAF